jgi:adenylate cyclase class 2
MLEIEQKYSGADFPVLDRQLAEWGVTTFEEHDEADHYFNAPDRDFARTGEAFRLRRAGAKSCLTYKGPRRAEHVKIRTEIEVPIGEGDQTALDMERVLVHLGYRPVAVVRKRRRTYWLKRGAFDVAICLDDVEGIGRFAEVEVLAPEDQLAQARSVMTDVATSLGLSDVEPRSYLTMLLERHGARGQGAE